MGLLYLYINVNFHFSVLELNRVQFSAEEDDDVITDSSKEGMKYGELFVSMNMCIHRPDFCTSVTVYL
jgi:hypothetical protein